MRVKRLSYKGIYRKITVNLKEEFFKAIKEKAEKEGKSMSVVLNEIIEQALKKNNN